MINRLINIIYSKAATTQETTEAGANADAIVNQITQPINTLVNVILGIVAAVGVIVFVKGIIELIPAWQERDSSGMWQAGKGLIVGLLLMSISLIVKIFYPGL